MDNSIIAGVFLVIGAMIGAIFQYLSARVGHRWQRAKKQIVQLCDQVAAYHQLESLYKVEVSNGASSGKNAETILREMRDRVEASGNFKRPKVTCAEANAIRAQWE